MVSAAPALPHHAVRNKSGWHCPTNAGSGTELSHRIEVIKSPGLLWVGCGRTIYMQKSRGSRLTSPSLVAPAVSMRARRTIPDHHQMKDQGSLAAPGQYNAKEYQSARLSGKFPDKLTRTTIFSASWRRAGPPLRLRLHLPPIQ